MSKKIVFAFAAASTLSLGALAQGVVVVPAAPPVTIVESGPATTLSAPHWVQRPDGSWAVAGGAYVQQGQPAVIVSGRDRDRDGTPDVADDDKDNDGVPNRYDSHPNNRWRD